MGDQEGALPLTVPSVLSVFPLCPVDTSHHHHHHSSGQKRVREDSPINIETPDNQEPLTLELLESILNPNADDQLGIMVERITIEPPAIKIRKQVNAFHRGHTIPLNMAKLKSKLTNVKSLVRKADPTKLIFTKSDKQKLARQIRQKALKEKPLMPAREYAYMPLNKFNVKMCDPYALFDYQSRVIQWCIDVEKGAITHPLWTAARGGLLSVKMGLGKTLITTTLIMNSISEQRSCREPTLYVCPFNLIGNVYREIDKFFGDQLKVMVYHADFLRKDFLTQTVQDFQNVDFVLTNYSTLTAVCKPNNKSVLSQVNFFRIILDESDEIRNHKTSRFKAACTVKSPRRWAMTGTPYHNSMLDYFAQLFFTGFRPKKLVVDEKTGIPRLKYDRTHFYKWNMKQMIFLLREQDCGSEYTLPKETVCTHYFNLNESKEVTQVYNAYAIHTRSVLNLAHASQSQEKAGLVRSINNGFFRLLQICTASHLIIPTKNKVQRKHVHEPDETIVAQGTMDTSFEHIFNDPALNDWVWNKHGTAGVLAPKMREFINVINIILPQVTVDKQPAKAIVFGNFTGSLRIAIEAGKTHFGANKWATMHRFIHGSIGNSKVRWQLLTEFRTDPRCRLLFMTLPMGKVGLNIIEANHVVFLEPWYSWASIAQGIGRARRIGQLNQVFVHFIIARNSTEESVLQIAMSKKTESSEIEAAVHTPPSLKDYDRYIRTLDEIGALDQDMNITETPTETPTGTPPIITEIKDTPPDDPESDPEPDTEPASATVQGSESDSNARSDSDMEDGFESGSDDDDDDDDVSMQ